MTRETVYAALASRLTSVLTGYAVTREMLPVSQCQAWPTAVVTAGNQVAESEDGDTRPTVWRLDAVVSLYLQRTDTATPFETVIHAAIDQVVGALAAQPGESTLGQMPCTTLGGVVIWAKVKGTVQIFRTPGDASAVVQIPVEMVAY